MLNDNQSILNALCLIPVIVECWALSLSRRGFQFTLKLIESKPFIPLADIRVLEKSFHD
jgi:hypothetical protein